MVTADVYYEGKLILRVAKLQMETETELWKRVKDNLLVVVPPPTTLHKELAKRGITVRGPHSGTSEGY
jgi:hypothetical protein